MVNSPVASNEGAQETPHIESPWYEAVVDPDSDTTPGKVVRLVGTGKRVLELGCATGYMSRVLRERGCQVVAIEINPSMADRAAAFCERVIVGDVEQIDLASELGEDRFDVIVAADILEHLKEPLYVLQAVKKYLRHDGYVVASIPNVAHVSVRLALLTGKFPYSKLGLLDRSHLRFFTRESIQKLFEDAGFVIGHADRLDVQVQASEVPFDRDAVPDGLVDALSKDPDALTYQFLVVAYPLPREGLDLIQKRFRELAEEKEAARHEATRLRQALDEHSARFQQTIKEQTQHIDALTARIEHLSSRNDVLRTSLLDAHDQLLRRDDEIQALRTREAQHQARFEREISLKEEHLRLYTQNREQHIAELQAALDRILYSPPGRLYRGIRKILSLGKP